MLTPMVPTVSSSITATLVNRDTLTPIPAAIITTGQTVQPEDFQYLGAFRLPGGDNRPETFAYGGSAMTFNPDGDPSGSSDGFPGSLFISGHDRMPYGELPNGSQVAEINIPTPVISHNLGDINAAEFLQELRDVTTGFFTGLDEIPRIGMQYLNHPATGPKIHLAWGTHFQFDPSTATHVWFDPNLSAPNMQGTWFIGNQNLYSVNGYMFEIPTSWADTYAQGRYLATGRMRDGGQGGIGPTLFAYRPWLAGGAAPASGTHLDETVLLLYENSDATDVITRCMSGYQHPDEWEGGAWITTSSGKSAVLFAGTKGNGTKYWYGYINPTGSAYPCVDADVTDYVTCRMTDGTSCPPEDFTGCCSGEDGSCPSLRGWWTTHFDAQFIMYNPADLAQVATGTMKPWEPQPYADLDIDDHLYLNPSGTDLDMLGTGEQRRYRIGDVAFDRANGLLYVLEQYADGAKPVVHVWRVQ
jgi:hypothetical protein